MNTHSPLRPTALWPTRAAWFAASLATLGGVLVNREPDWVLGTGFGAFVVVVSVMGFVSVSVWAQAATCAAPRHLRYRVIVTISPSS